MLYPLFFFETVLFFDNILYICSHNKLIRERGNYYERKWIGTRNCGAYKVYTS